MSDAADGLPEFTVVLRGYDRPQVDEYVGRQAARLEEAWARIRSSEQQLAQASQRPATPDDDLASTSAPRSIEQLGERVGRILAEAWEAAEELRRQAVAETEAARVDAQSQAGAVLDDAQHQADGRRAEGEAEAATVIAAAERRRNEVETEMARLEAQRAEALEAVARLHDVLGGALGQRSAEASLDLRQGPTASAASEPADEVTGPTGPTGPAGDPTAGADITISMPAERRRVL